MNGNQAEDPPRARLAAQYVRMSTERQCYSIESQSEANHQFADRSGFSIIATYSDEGKSGVSINGRRSLETLLDDVVRGVDFTAIIVYDVSRWGRFQDIYESAYYEYLCRRSGVDVFYCAEQFGNGRGISDSIIKTLKRAMAGEYSRELSEKVFKGHCKLSREGFRQGGRAPFGIARKLVSRHGEVRGTLQNGEYKALTDDKVLLCAGTNEDVKLIKWVFDSIARDRCRPHGLHPY